MVLNSYGQIAERQLDWLEQQYGYIDLHAAVVMPNHIHAVIEINDRVVPVRTDRGLSVRNLSGNMNGNNNLNVGRGLPGDATGDGDGVGTGRDLSNREYNNYDARPGGDNRTGHDTGTGHGDGTGHDLSLQQQQTVTKIKSLSELMGAYKTTSSKQIHLAGLPTFNWQRSFHDHIIRNEESYLRISNYILNHYHPNDKNSSS